MSAVAVVTTVRGRHRHLRRQAASLQRAALPPDVWVVVAMGDPGVVDVVAPASSALPVEVVDLPVDGPLPLARARNVGADVAIEAGAQVLVFLDVDCLAAPDLVAGYAEAVQRCPDTVFSGPVTYLPEDTDEALLTRLWVLDDPHPARPAPRRGETVHDAEPALFWSLSFAVSATTWRRIGGFCEEYTGYGAEDTDFGFTAADRGVGLAWVGDARAYHQHHAASATRERAADLVRNGALFARRWGWWPMAGWFEELEREQAVRRTTDGWELVE